MDKKHPRSLIVHFFALALLTALLAACGTSVEAQASVPGSGASGTAPSVSTPTTTSGGSHGSTSSHQVSGPLTTIRMLTTANGWALTQNAVLKTADGGLHWYDVTPARVPDGGYATARGDFMSTQVAWVASAQLNANTVTVQRTTNGGQSWQTTTISSLSPEAVDAPHFRNSSEGWLEVIGSPGAGQQPAEIYHSTDGGLHWTKIASSLNPQSGLLNSGFKSGISFVNSLIGFAATRFITGEPANPGLFVTYDGGHTWRAQAIPMPQGITVQQIGTTPPVFFGASGLLPVYVMTSSLQHELILYRTNDSGAHWTPTAAANLDAGTVYVSDLNHAWASDQSNGNFFYTSDGGTSWHMTANTPGTLKEMSFVDAYNGWAITATALLHTMDGGKNWSQINYSIQ